MNDISLEKIESDVGLIKDILLKSPHVTVDIVEYRTHFEPLDTACYFIGRKSDFGSPLAAFIMLLNYQIHYVYDEWNILEMTPEAADGILENFLFPDIKKAKFRSITKEEVHEQMDWIVGEIKKLIEEAKGDPRWETSRPDLWGIYWNGNLVDPNENFVLPISPDIKSALGLEMEWNEIELFYETSDEYVIFSWGTTA
jgi:hypothetical protein